MAAISSLFSPKPFSRRPSMAGCFSPSQSLHRPSCLFQNSCVSVAPRTTLKVQAQAQEAVVATKDTASEAARRLYVGNIPRTVSNDELRKVFEDCGAVEKAEVMYDKYSGRSRRFAFVTMNSVDDATTAIDKLNDTEIGGRKIKVNITEKPLQSLDLSIPPSEDSEFVDSPYKVYVGNLAKTVTSEILTRFFSENGKVLGAKVSRVPGTSKTAKVSRVPGTSKTSGFGFVSFSSDEEVEAAIAEFNNALLEGQSIRVNKA